MSQISIVIVLYNEEKRIKPCLESLKSEAQSYKENIEILFIDNNSKDQSVKVIDDWRNENSNLDVKIIKRKKNHLAEARQQALEEAQNDFVAFIDADCSLKPGWMRSAFLTMDEWEDGTGACGGISIFKGQKSWHKFATSLAKLFPWGKVGGIKHIVSHMPTNNYLVSKKLALEVGGFHSLFSRVGEDLDFNIRLSSRYKIYFTPNFQVDHELPSSYFDWLRKMAFYGRAQSMVLLKNKGGVPGSKFFPLLFVFLSIYFLMTIPVWSQLALIIALIIPRLRFFTLSFFFYGFGEIVGAFIFLFSGKKHS